jgi:hypothetical protein
MSDGLLVGREEEKLDRARIAGGTDRLYAAQLLDGARATAATFEHCTFANVSFKDVILERCRFVNCAFLDCYFRHTTIRSCIFEACKFEDCEFQAPSFVDSAFAFPNFRGCFIPFDAFGDGLPLDPGHRHRIADELAREASLAGALSDARRYRLRGEAAFEKHQWNLAWASGGKYYEKPRPPLDRARAGVKWFGRKFNRHLWGYGERGLVLARSFLLVSVLFGLAFWLLVGDGLSYRGSGLDVANYLLFSFDNLLAGTGFSQISVTGTFARWLTGLEVLVGLVFIGLSISLVFNWIRRR